METTGTEQPGGAAGGSIACLARMDHNSGSLRKYPEGMKLITGNWRSETGQRQPIDHIGKAVCAMRGVLFLRAVPPALCVASVSGVCWRVVLLCC